MPEQDDGDNHASQEDRNQNHRNLLIPLHFAFTSLGVTFKIISQNFS